MSSLECLPNAVLCLIAIIFAKHVPRLERDMATFAAWAIALDWLLYVMSWSPWSLWSLFHVLGLPFGDADVWAITDAIVSAFILGAAFASKWGWMLWILLFAQVGLHVIRSGGAIEFDPYSRTLDVLFWGQIGCFILWGGRGVRDRLSDIHAGLRLWGRSRASASVRTVKP